MMFFRQELREITVRGFNCLTRGVVPKKYSICRGLWNISPADENACCAHVMTMNVDWWAWWCYKTIRLCKKRFLKKGCRRRFWAKPQRIKCCASLITRFNTDWQVYGYYYDKQCPLKLSEKAGIDRLPTQFITNLIIELKMLKNICHSLGLRKETSVRQLKHTRVISAHFVVLEHLRRLYVHLVVSWKYATFSQYIHFIVTAHLVV